jgi:uncharacterized integral membrane protein
MELLGSRMNRDFSILNPFKLPVALAFVSVGSMFFLLEALIQNNLLVVLHTGFNYYAPFFLMALILLSDMIKSRFAKHRGLFKFLSKELVYYVAIFGLGFSFFGMVFSPNDLFVYGSYSYYFSSFFVWLLTFLLLWALIIASDKEDNLIKSFCLAVSGVMLSSILYELPWYLASGNWTVLFVYPKAIFSVLILLFFLKNQKSKRLVFLGFMAYLLMSVAYFNLPYFLVRLSPLPFMLSLYTSRVEKP